MASSHSAKVRYILKSGTLKYIMVVLLYDFYLKNVFDFITREHSVHPAIIPSAYTWTNEDIHSTSLSMFAPRVIGS